MRILSRIGRALRTAFGTDYGYGLETCLACIRSSAVDILDCDNCGGLGVRQVAS